MQAFLTNLTYIQTSVALQCYLMDVMTMMDCAHHQAISETLAWTSRWTTAASSGLSPFIIMIKGTS